AENRIQQRFSLLSELHYINHAQITALSFNDLLETRVSLDINSKYQMLNPNQNVSIQVTFALPMEVIEDLESDNLLETEEIKEFKENAETKIG
ncbi:5016_t:CDS:2, partial [Gigaspora rosea]